MYELDYVSKVDPEVADAIKKEISRQDLERYLKFGKTKCSYILSSLLKKGFIKKIDSGKNVKYIENI